MQKAIYSSATYVRNLGFSLFMSLLYAKNLNQSCENICIEKKMNKKILGKSSNKILTFGNNEYQQYIKKCYDETYRNCIDVIIKNYQINDIIECFENTCINKTLTFLPSIQERKNEALLIKIANFNALVENERKLLKEKIIKQRVINPIKHNDLENCFPKYWYIEDCEACHIFDIYRIKELGRKHIYNGNEHLLTNLLDDCSNPNNGLLLLSQWHDYFDKDLISFNTNGEIVLLIEKDKEDRLEPINPNNNIAKVKIKNQYFNGKMEKYFAKRN
jgi:hypothetical protein